MTWGIVILLVRGLASIVGALAGIAALLSDGALAKRQQPAKGFWKGTPFEHRRITRWGAVLLSVIIFAPVTQFCGDVLKDMNSDKQLRSTTDDIKKSISSEVSQSTTRLESQVGSAIEKSDTQLVKAVGNSTSELKSNVESVVDKSVGEASGKIVGLVRDGSRLQKQYGERIVKNVSGVSGETQGVLLDMDRSLYPFEHAMWAYELRINISNPAYKTIRDRLRTIAKAYQKRFPNFGKDLKQGGDEQVGDYFSRYGQRPRVLLHIDSPDLPSSLEGFGGIFGYDLLVDIFKSEPKQHRLSDGLYRSSDYAATILQPYNVDTYGMQRDNFPPENYRQWELIYFPALPNDSNSDQCYVDCYWHAMASFDDIAENTQSSILGLPDLCDSEFVIRLYTLHSFWKSGPPYYLEYLRLRTGKNEISLSNADLGNPVQTGDFLVYRKRLPTSFKDLMSYVSTVRSDQDIRPLPSEVRRLGSVRHSN